MGWKPEAAPTPLAPGPSGPVDGSSTVRFGDFEADLQSGELRRQGEKVKIQEKPFQLLATLLEQAGKVVAREELRQRLWPAATFVDFEMGLNTAVRKLRQALDDSAESPRYIETLPKRGYRFIGPPPVLLPARAAPAAARDRTRGPGWPRWAAGLVTGAVIAVAVVLAGRTRPATPAAGTGKPTLAVLPLENLGRSPDDDYIAHGLTETLITELARAPGVIVIAGNSVFQYQRRRVDFRQLGKDLRVSHVLEGSVQRDGDQLRVSAQLVEVATGRHLWAQSYDRPAQEAFAMQDDIADRVTEALRGVLSRARGPTALADPRAYDAYLRGRYRQHGSVDKWWAAAAPLYEQAVALDPGFALAHAALANAYIHVFFYEDPDRTWEERAYAEVEKALALDADLPEAYLARGNLAWTWPNRFPHHRAMHDFRKALAINPSLADARVALARLYQHVGLLDEALAQLTEALRVDPHHAEAALRVVATHVWQHRHAEALAEMEGSSTFGRNNYLKGVALAYAGREAEARRFIEGILARQPDDLRSRSFHAVLLARAGDRAGAERDIAQVAAAARNDRGYSSYHHAQYHVGLAWALLHESPKALEWLQRAANEGFPCYPFFAGDPNLTGLRGDPAFDGFMARLRQEWEQRRQSVMGDLTDGYLKRSDAKSPVGGRLAAGRLAETIARYLTPPRSVGEAE